MIGMKGIFKRFKLSEWLIICQLVSSIIALVMSTANNFIADAFGLVWNIVNSLALLIVFLRNNARNYKSYEVTGQFIFNKLGNSFSDFMDFLMSDEYKPNSFEEQALLQDKLFEIAKNGEYDDRRKISRALPYLFDIDKKMTFEIAKVLRDDIINETTDIRRRTIESMLSIVQKTDGIKKQKKLYKKYKGLFEYLQYDDSYTIVASIESYFYCYAFVASKKKEKDEILKSFEKLKSDVKEAFDAGVGKITDTLVNDMDAIWETLMSLYAVGHSKASEVAEARSFIENILATGGKFPKLTVVKNLYYTCKHYPACLSEKNCSAISSNYMMVKINDFLTTAIEGDVFLSMPTVRYFDCVCNNIHQRESGKQSHEIMRNYYIHSDMLINQTAFDKFSRLRTEEPEFAKEVLGDLLDNNVQQLAEESAYIIQRIEELPQEKKGYFLIKPGRTKIKKSNCSSFKARQEREKDAELCEIDCLLEKHYERIRFVGKIKQLQEEISQ